MASKDKVAGKVSAAFGAINRARLINEYFSAKKDEVLPVDEAWSHVYRLLLWADQTNGLAHCYESDKSQPGKRWYSRSLAFHDWVSTSLGTTPGALSSEIDWLFQRAAEDLASEVIKKAARVAQKATEQLKPYEHRGFPRPGEDPELVHIVKDVLGDHLGIEPTPEVWGRLVQRVRQYLALENKRKNLVGEGFEDVLSQVIERSRTSSELEVHTRRALHELPGFHRHREGAKLNKVDVAVVRNDVRTLVTAKWSVRADREKQFTTDLTDYIQSRSDSKPFKYVFVTNEFDPARLMRACEQLSANSWMFDHVVHISTDAIKATYGLADGDQSESASIKKVLKYIDEGRLISLSHWLTLLNAGP